MDGLIHITQGSTFLRELGPSASVSLATTHTMTVMSIGYPRVTILMLDVFAADSEP